MFNPLVNAIFQAGLLILSSLVILDLAIDRFFLIDKKVRNYFRKDK